MRSAFRRDTLSGYYTYYSVKTRRNRGFLSPRPPPVAWVAHRYLGMSHEVVEARPPEYFSIGDLAVRWRGSRGAGYNMIRGERVLDFAAPGRRGKKLVPATVVVRIEERWMKVFR